jgi:hypothetical protein
VLTTPTLGALKECSAREVAASMTSEVMEPAEPLRYRAGP